MPVFTIKPLAEKEGGELLEILGIAFGDLYNPTDTRVALSSPEFNSADCFIAEQAGSVIGSVAVTSLARSFWFVIRYLAVAAREDRVEIARALVQKALEHARAKGAVSIRATTPAVEPYVEVYREFGFAPVRKDFRITWELDAGRQVIVELPLRVLEVSETNVATAADLFVRTLTPLWDWRTEEHGGPEAEALSFRNGLRRGEKWFLCLLNDEPVGLTGMMVDFYKPGWARFRGAYVAPENRGRGVGLSVMSEAMRLARSFGQNRMTIYTFSFLDRLAPGAGLYLRSGGMVDAEYVQLKLPVLASPS